jgi:hypothetical protein
VTQPRSVLKMNTSSRFAGLPAHPALRRRLTSLGVNAHGEVLEAGRVSDCYLGLRLDPDKDLESAGVLGKEQHMGEHSDEVDD